MFRDGGCHKDGIRFVPDEVSRLSRSPCCTSFLRLIIHSGSLDSEKPSGAMWPQGCLRLLFIVTARIVARPNFRQVSRET